MQIDVSGYAVLVDEEDFPKIKDMRWYISPYTHKAGGKASLYVECGICTSINGKNTQSKVRLHRFLMGCSPNDGRVVDHIDGNTLNNQKHNLRICSSADNARNRGKNINNSSGYKGVTWDKVTNMWRAQLQYGDMSIKLGRFNTPEEAYQAYVAKATELHGEFVHV